MGGATRRHVVTGSAAGAVTLGLGASPTGGSAHAAAPVAAPRKRGVLDLYVNEGFVPMVDGSLVYRRGFGDAPTDRDDPAPNLTCAPRVFLAGGGLVQSRSFPLGAPLPPHGAPEPKGPDPRSEGHYLIHREYWASFFPRRTIIVETGSVVRIRVHNRLREVHELAIPGVKRDRTTATTGPIPPGGVGRLKFRARRAGTYLYTDPTNTPVERVLGLHGGFVVVPRRHPWRLARGEGEFERQWLWLCQDVEPEWARLAQRGRTVDPDPRRAVPRYFMLNDLSGFQAVGESVDDVADELRHEDTLVAGAPRLTDVRDFSKPDGAGGVVTGQLVRMINVGLVIHQMHFHGNHVWTISDQAKHMPRSRGHIDPEGHVRLQAFEDVVELDPLHRKDIMLPMRRPPEVVPEVWQARREDWVYPMHCHAEPSQTAAGGLYPGGLVGHWTLTYPGPDRKELERHRYASQVEFASNTRRVGNPETEFLQPPDRYFQRQFYNDKLTFPDGSEHEMWAFRDEQGNKAFPSPLIRVTEGDLVHVELKAGKRSHTIHLHGMEPDPRNDGVGHTSFEVNGHYTYQWRPQVGDPGDPNVGSAGCYFYHCHVNTVLHVQLGMVGPIIIDPAPDPAFPEEPGARRAFAGGPLYDTDSEMLLVPYSLDPRWHELHHAAGMSGEDAGLNRFEPTSFHVLGGMLADGAPTEGVWAATELRARAHGHGHPALLRLLNANYFPTRVRFTHEDGTPAAIAEAISHDGRGFYDTSTRTGPSRRVSTPLTTDVLAFGSAERYAVLLHPPEPGRYEVHVDWSDWRLDGSTIARRTVPLTVT